RGYAGQLASGVIERDDEVVVMPEGLRTRIVAIDTFDGEVEIAHAPQSVTLRLADEFDVGREVDDVDAVEAEAAEQFEPALEGREQQRRGAGPHDRLGERIERD